jgi:hypothetical protein
VVAAGVDERLLAGAGRAAAQPRWTVAFQRPGKAERPLDGEPFQRPGVRFGGKLQPPPTGGVGGEAWQHACAGQQVVQRGGHHCGGRVEDGCKACPQGVGLRQVPLVERPVRGDAPLLEEAREVGGLAEGLRLVVVGRGVSEVDRLSCCTFVFVDEAAEDVTAVELPRCG